MPLDAWLAIQVRLFLPLGVALLGAALGLLAHQRFAPVLSIAALAVVLCLALLHGLVVNPWGLAVIGATLGQIATLIWIGPNQLRPPWKLWVAATITLVAAAVIAGPLTDPLPPPPQTVLEPEAVGVWSPEDVESATGDLRNVAAGSIVITGHLPDGNPWFIQATRWSDPNLSDCAGGRISGPAWADENGIILPLDAGSHDSREVVRYGVRLALGSPGVEPRRAFGTDRFRGSFCVDEGGLITTYDPPYLIGY